jgi:hypothetical protein
MGCPGADRSSAMGRLISTRGLVLIMTYRLRSCEASRPEKRPHPQAHQMLGRFFAAAPFPTWDRRAKASFRLAPDQRIP